MTRVRVHPSASPPPCPDSPSTSGSCTRKRQVLTVWMKSLVLHGYGCTVYDSRGDVVYRVDNYDRRCPGQAFLMDGEGRDVLAITRKKKLGLLETSWDAYRCNGRGTSGSSSKRRQATSTPWFSIRSPPPAGFLNKGRSSSFCEVHTGDSPDGVTRDRCRIERITGTKSSAYRLVNMEGALIAEVKRKQTAAGVILGDDVLTLVVEPDVDVSFAVGVAVVYGMVNQKL